MPYSMAYLGPGKRALTALLGLGFSGVPVLTWSMNLYKIVKDDRARATWVATDCVVADVKFWQSTGNGPHGLSAMSPITLASIRYDYTFRGEHYTSEDVDLRSIDGLHSGNERDYVMFIRGYVIGQHTGCWVDPDRPDHAVLTIDMPPGAYDWQWATGLFFVLVGLSLIVFARQRGRIERPLERSRKASADQR